ncbi:MAG: ArnT family glycosyltransferase [Planctomycetaceae bacterium]
MTEPQTTTTWGMTPPARLTSRWPVIAIALMLVGQAIVMTLTAARLSTTHDEYWHIPVGLLHWKTGRFDFEPSNPPLLRMWATWPLLFTSADSPRTEPTTDLNRFGDEFLAANPESFDRYVVIARLPIILLTVAAGALLARWAWEWNGPWSACLVTWLWSREPTVLAHGSLMTTDAGGAALWIAALFAAWRFAQRPNTRHSVLAGVLLGLAQAAKFTNVLLVPLVVGLWCLERWRNESVEPLDRRTGLQRWGVLLLSAWLCLNAAYLFRGTGTSLHDFQFASRSARTWQERLGSLPVPLPRDYVTGIDRQKAVMESDHAVFLDGELSTKGFGHYYLMTLLYKWPHSIHVLLLWAAIKFVAAFVAAFARTRGGEAIQSLSSQTASAWRQPMWCLIPAALVLSVASSSGMQLGIRYVLPAIPLLLLFASGVLRGRVCEFQKSPMGAWEVVKPRTAISEIRTPDPGISRWQPLAVGALLLICDPWHSHPEYLAYFNEFAGGSEDGRWHLVDSNLDWGQDLHELKRFVAEHPQMEPLSLAYFGTLPPDSLGLRYENPPTRQPRPGWHAVSVNFVMGLPGATRDGHGGMRAVYPGEDYSYFQRFDPKYHIGASIDLYYLNPDSVPVLEPKRSVSMPSR